MTALAHYAESQLRARLEHSLSQLKPEPSLYLLALGAVYLAVDDANKDAKTMLETVFFAQATADGLDGDEVLSGLCMVNP